MGLLSDTRSLDNGSFKVCLLGLAAHGFVRRGAARCQSGELDFRQHRDGETTVPRLGLTLKCRTPKFLYVCTYIHT